MKGNLTRHAAACLIAAAVAGCHYDFAAVEPNEMPTDPATAGRWIQAGPADQDDGFRQLLVIVPSRQGGAFADLLVDPETRWFFRAHRLADDLPGLYQLELLGASDGSRPEKDPFTVASVGIDGGRLGWRLVDPEKVGEVRDGKELMKRIRSAAASGEDLFGDPQWFTPAPN